MKTMYITVGISCSGKSTWAAQKIHEGSRFGRTVIELNRDITRFNVVKPGTNWSTYKMNKTNENEVTARILSTWDQIKNEDVDVIISDTNLNPKYRQAWVDRGNSHGFKVEIVEFDITVEEAMKRDAIRPNGVGSSVIFQQHLKLQEIKGKVYKADTKLPKAIIVDIDGTVADKNDRKPFDWKRVGEDTPRSFVIDLVLNYQLINNVKIIFLSGRDGSCYQETLSWINKHMGIDKDLITLYMRPINDYRKDTEIKEEIFWDKIASHYNVVGAFDDRPCVLRLWHTIQIPNVISVGNPFIEF